MPHIWQNEADKDESQTSFFQLELKLYDLFHVTSNGKQNNM